MESAPTGGKAKPQPPAGAAAARGAAGWGHPALRPPGWLRSSRLVQSIQFVRRGGIYPARGRSRRRGVPGTMQASSPTQVCNYIRAAVFRVAVHPDIGCRGGFHIRPRTFAPPRVPGTISGLRPGLTARLASERRLRAQCKHRRPTQVCNYIRAAVFRVAVHPDIGCRGGFHIRPRTFAPPQTGPIWNRPLQGVAVLCGLRFPGWPGVTPGL